jgi:hypothetical protein
VIFSPPKINERGDESMSIFDFKKRFGKEIDKDEVKKAFVNHLNFKLLESLDDETGRYYSDHSAGKEIFDAICLYINENPTQVVKNYNTGGFYYHETTTPPLRYLTHDDFEKTLLVVEAAYKYFQNSGHYRKNAWLKMMDLVVSEQLEAPLSLGISWVSGKFIPEGAEELQDVLIEDNLIWLLDYPETQKLFRAALNDYAGSRGDEVRRKNAMSNSFQAVEQLARTFLSTDKAFDNIFSNLVDSLALHSHWKQICYRWNELAKEFARHSGREQKTPNQEDAEAFIYLSGLLLRLIIQKIK